MTTSVAIDQDLLDKAQTLYKVDDAADVVNAALKAFIRQTEAARYLSKAGGTMPNLAYIPRRRSQP